MRRMTTLAVFASTIALAIGSAAPALAAPAGHGRDHGPRYYLALGDSLSVGIQPDAAGTDVPTDQGYPDQLEGMLQRRGHDLRLVKLGCSGETTVTLINGGICSYPGGGTQLAAASQFLRQHRGQVHCGSGGRSRGCGRRLLEFVDGFDAHEQNQRDEHKIKKGLQKGAVLDEHILAGGVEPQAERQIREIHAADDFAQRRHDDIAHQRRHNFPERRADDHTDRQIDDVSLHRKFFEF